MRSAAAFLSLFAVASVSGQICSSWAWAENQNEYTNDCKCYPGGDCNYPPDGNASAEWNWIKYQGPNGPCPPGAPCPANYDNVLRGAGNAIYPGGQTCADWCGGIAGSVPTPSGMSCCIWMGPKTDPGQPLPSTLAGGQCWVLKLGARESYPRFRSPMATNRSEAVLPPFNVAGMPRDDTPPLPLPENKSFATMLCNAYGAVGSDPPRNPGVTMEEQQTVGHLIGGTTWQMNVAQAPDYSIYEDGNELSSGLLGAMRSGAPGRSALTTFMTNGVQYKLKDASTAPTPHPHPAPTPHPHPAPTPAPVPHPTGPCYTWCNSYTCGMLNQCGGCTSCTELKDGDYCSSWCNEWTCSFDHCTGCSVCESSSPPGFAIAG